MTAAAEAGWRCQVVLDEDDFIPMNHHVHGVPVVPGVTFLDLVLRAFGARRGRPATPMRLDDVRFQTAVATAPGRPRRLTLDVEPGTPAGQRIRLSAEPLAGSGAPESVMTAVVAPSGPDPAHLDLSAIEGGCSRSDDMSVLYDLTRGEGIVHGPAMRAAGSLRWGEGPALARLSLDPDGAAVGSGLLLHPGLLDAATLVAFGRRRDVGAEPFIPFSIGSVELHAPLPSGVVVHVPRVERLAPSGEVLQNDLDIATPSGEVVVRFLGISCKRIRDASLIQGLVEGRRLAPSTWAVEPSPGPTQAVTQSSTQVEDGADAVGAARRVLCRDVGEMLGVEPGGISLTAGFFDLGLDSVALLSLGERLDEQLRTRLYPTLLFEYSTIADLADHLAAEHGPRFLELDAEVEAPAEPNGALGASTEPGAAENAAAASTTTPTTTGTAAAPAETAVFARVARRAPAWPDDVVMGPAKAVGPFGAEGAALVGLADATGEPDVGLLFLPAGEAPEEARAAVEILLDILRGLRDRRLVVGVAGSPAAFAAVSAAARVARLELPGVDLVVAGARERGQLAGELRRLLASDPGPHVDDVWVDEDGRRTTTAWREVAASEQGEPALPDGAVVLIAGGLGAIGQAVAEHVIRRHRARVALIGRTRRSLSEGLADREEVMQLAADVKSADDVRRAVEQVRGRWGHIDAVFNLAGQVQDGIIARTERLPGGVWAPKTEGTVNLVAATRDDPPQLLVLFSSLAAVLPQRGQVSYAAASGWQLFPDLPVAEGTRIRSIAWPFWAQGGMRLGEANLAQAAETGAAPLPTAAALATLDAILSGGEAQTAVIHGTRGADGARPYLQGLPLADAADAADSADHRSDPEETNDPDAAARPGPPHSAGAGDAEPIAIIGMAGRYPDAPDLDAFWDNLTQGRDSITEIPGDRWDHGDYDDPERGKAGRSYAKWGGFLDGIDQFDPAFFGISRRDAARMDPQERAFLMVAWQAMESAGYPPGRRAGYTIGCYVGVMWNHYTLLGELDGGVAPMALHASISSRVSFCLDLTGPTLALDTACSSSLTAIHLAVTALRNGDADMMLVGGVNLNVHPQKYLQLARDQFLADDGRCRAFGEGGTGYVPGEGAGALVLKPLSRALSDGDMIHAVVAGTSVNHSGRTGGFTVPSPEPQARLIRAALRSAGWQSSDLTYVEAHGTGTALGDPIEVDGLTRALWSEPIGDASPLGGVAVGSVKTNIGHLESAAGVAGVTKVVLQLRHRALVPSLHASPRNARLDLEATPLRVVEANEPWHVPAGKPRRAGVSAFGASGANSHVLLEEAPPLRESASGAVGTVPVVLSARSDAGLDSLIARLLARVKEPRAPRDSSAVIAAAARLLQISPSEIRPEDTLEDLGLFGRTAELLAAAGLDAAMVDPTTTLAGLGGRAAGALRLGDLAYTLGARRSHLSVRAAVRTDSVGDLVRLLEEWVAGDRSSWVCSGEGPDADPLVRWVNGDDAALPGLPETGRCLDLPAAPFELSGYWVGRWAGGHAVTLVPPPDSRHRGSDPSPRSLPTPDVSPAPSPRTQARTSPMSDRVRVLVDDAGDGVRVVSFDTGTPGNLLTGDLMEQIGAALADLAGHDDARSVVLTGAPDLFSLGADEQGLAELAAGDRTFADTPYAFRGLLDCPLPVIAAVRGDAGGGGLSFALSADLTVLDASGRYGAAYLRYGFTPGMGATAHLPFHLGSLAAEMMLTAREFTGRQLAERGAGCSVVESGRVLEHAIAVARAVAAFPPAAVRALKHDLAQRRLEPLVDAVGRELGMHAEVLGTGEAVARALSRFPQSAHRRDDAAREQEAGPAPEPERRPAAVVEAAPPAPVQPTPAAEPARECADGPEASPGEDPGAVTDRVTGVVLGALTEGLHAHESEIDPQLSFTDLGLDSIGVIDLVRAINDAFSLDVETTDVYDHPTLERLVAYLSDAVVERSRTLTRLTSRRQWDAGPVPVAPAPVAVPVASAQDTVAASPAPAQEPSVAPTADWADEAPRARASVSPARREVPELVLAVPLADDDWEPPAPADAARPQDDAAGAAVEPAPAPAEPIEERPTPAPTPQASGPSSLREYPPDAVAIIGVAGRFPDADTVGEYWANLIESRDSVTVVPPHRWDVESVWSADKSAPGRTVSKWGAFIDHIASFDERRFRLSPLEAESMDPQQRLFLEVGWQAVEDAGYLTDDTVSRPWGIFVGCARGDYEDLLREHGRHDSAQAFLGLSTSVLAARLAYVLNLTGPTVAIDTACSSSLVAVHEAAEAVRRGECEAAIAGGVALMVTPHMHVLTSKSGMLSPTGRCRPFAAEADGIVLGEACGAIVVKRLDRAIADGDDVRAVIVASGVNGDGRTNGITAPSATSQSTLLRDVHERAGLAPGDLGYVEAHGTGTPLGDPIEIRALLDALPPSPGGPVLLGSVKGNIGHTTVAAGIAGLLKVVLALRHRLIPPSLNASTVTDTLAAADARLRLVQRPTDWPSGNGRRYGAVSSFGFSGTNAHVVVADYPTTPEAPEESAGRLALPLSAPSEDALARLHEGIGAWAARPEPETTLASVVRALARRPAGAVRGILVAERLSDLATAPLITDADLLPGDLPAAAGEAARTHLAGSASPSGWGVPDGPRAWVPPTPGRAARHWIGVAPEATRTAPDVRIPCDDVRVAQHCVGGRPLLPGAAVVDLMATAAELPLRLDRVRWLRPVVADGDTLRLRVDHPAGGSEVRVLDARNDTVHASARLGTAPDACGAVPSHSPVRGSGQPVDIEAFYAGMTAAGIDYGPAFRCLIEAEVIGADDDRVAEVAATVRRPAQPVAEHRVPPTMLDAALQTIALLPGASSSGATRVPFAVERLDLLASWPDEVHVDTRQAENGLRITVRAPSGNIVARFDGVAVRDLPKNDSPVVLVPVLEPVPGATTSPAGSAAILPGDADEARALEESYVAAGRSVTVVGWAELTDASWWRRMPDLGEVDVILAGVGPDLARADEWVLALRGLVTAAADAGRDRQPLVLSVLTHHALSASGVLATDPAAAAATAFLNGVRHEFPRWTVRALDTAGLVDRPHLVPSALAGAPTSEGAAAQLRPDGTVGYLGVRHRPAPATADAWQPADRVLVAGGMGGIGVDLVRALLARGADVAVIGRRDASELPEDARAVADDAHVRYVRCDLGDGQAVHAAVEDLTRDWGAIGEAFHLGMVLHDGSILRTDPGQMRDVLAVKTHGTRNLIDALQGRCGRLTLFSSVISQVPPPGQAAYAAASAFQDAVAWQSNGALDVRTIDWGFWGSIGAVATQEHAATFARLGVCSIELEPGLAAMGLAQAGGSPHSVIIACDDLGRAGLKPARDADPAETDPYLALDRWAAEETCRALPSLPAQVGGRHRRLVEALRRVGKRAAEETRWVPSPDELRARWPFLTPHIAMVESCLAGLGDVLSGAAPAVGVLFGAGSDPGSVYGGDAIADHFHRTLARAAVEECREAHRRTASTVRVLEVGAGTGASTGFALAALRESGVDFRYTFSDVSAGFLRSAEKRFAEHRDRLEFTVLDIDAVPQYHGEYDVVLATNVLHATPDVVATLRSTARLLAPGGTLLINEVMASWDFLTVSFGLTDGWWAFEDGERRLPDSPLLALDGWAEALEAAGFGAPDVKGATKDAGGHTRQAVLRARVSAPQRVRRVVVEPAPRAVASPRPAVGATSRVTPDATAEHATEIPLSAVRNLVRESLARTLKMPAAEIDDEESLEAYGVDSLVGLEVLADLETWAGPLSAMTLFDHPSVSALARHLLSDRGEEVRTVVSAGQAPAIRAEEERGSGRTDAGGEDTDPAAESARAGGVAAGHARLVGADPGPAEATGPVAVVGIAGRYGGVGSLEQLWQVFQDGGSTVAPIPASRFDIGPWLSESPRADQRTVSRWASMLDDVAGFDAGFFGILPRDCDLIDPQERLFLECSWQLMETAGYVGPATSGARTGVFVGAMYGAYAQLGATRWSAGELAGPTSSRWSIANRVSYVLDLHGPSVAVDTACSSSLTAVHLACDSIRRGECDMAIAGGVNVILHPAHHVSLSALNMLSPDGTCHVFDDRANGFVPGEGVGAVLLKPLSAAQRDGDTVYGVILGSQAGAGGRTRGYTVPSAESQADLLARTWAQAGVTADDIGYIEAHGTGTSLGDPIEVDGIRRALRLATAQPRREPVLLGSAKANLGHLEGAAGIVALTKVLYQLRDGLVPPCAGLERVNAEIDLSDGLIDLPTGAVPFPEGPRGRVAGVSSFGAGGSNLHLVVAQAPEPPAPTDGGAPATGIGIFVLSARSRPGLEQLARACRDLLADGRGPATTAELWSWCATSALSRKAHRERAAFLVSEPADLESGLAAFLEGRDARDRVLVGTAPAVFRAGDDPVADARHLLAESVEALARAWVDGRDVDLAVAWERLPSLHAVLPPTPMARTRHWFTDEPVVPAPPTALPSADGPAVVQDPPAAVAAASGTVDDAADESTVRVAVPRWEPAQAAEPASPQRVGVIGDDDLAAALTEAADARGHRVTRLAATVVDDLRLEGLDALVVEQPAHESARDATWWACTVARAVKVARTPGDPQLRMILTRTVDDVGCRTSDAVLKVLAAEAPGIRPVVITHECGSARDRATRILDVLDRPDDEELLARDGLHTRTLRPVTLPSPTGTPWQSGTYVVTGGGRGLGLEVARRLSRVPGARVITLGRHEAVESLPGVEHRILDITDHAQLAALVDEVGAELVGLVHCAAVLRDQPLESLDEVAFDEVWSTKASTITTLDDLTADSPLEHVVLFGSVVAESGQPGQAAYAAANRYLAEFCVDREARRARGIRRGHCLTVQWGAWRGGGMVLSEAMERVLLRTAGMRPVDIEEGLDLLDRAVWGTDPVLVVYGTAGSGRDVDRGAADETDGADEVRAGAGGGAARVTDPDAGDLGRVDAARGADLDGRLLEVLRELVAGFLKLPPEEVDSAVGLLEVGFDSVSLTELVDLLGERLRIALPTTFLFEAPTLGSIAESLVRDYPTEVAAALTEKAAASPTDGAPGDDPAEVVADDASPEGACPDEARAPEPADVCLAAPARTTSREVSPLRASDTPEGAEVAVCGLSVRVPGAADQWAFWDLLDEGRIAYGPVTAERAGLTDLGDVASSAGLVDGIAQFDASAFRITPHEAQWMDPQQRMTLQAVVEAVEASGHPVEELAGTRCGVFVGVSTSDYSDLISRSSMSTQAHTATGVSHAALAGRVSHLLDLRGPCESVDTACSSSLVALHRAVQSLRAGECDRAVVVGVSALLSKALFTAFEESGMLSPRQLCTPFAEGADGYVRGEGVVAVLLRRRDAAEADRDPILALVHGSAVAHGGRATSLTAPSLTGQIGVITAAHAAARAYPARLVAVEAHGTGTALGDPVEIDGLTRALGVIDPDVGATPVLVGAVKANIGHLESAAGLAGAAKALLALRHGRWPGTPGAEHPSTRCDWSSARIQVPSGPTDLPPTDRPWRVAVSSFGFSGVGAHVVLDAPVRPAQEADDGRPHLLIVSARDDERLAKACGRLAAWLTHSDEPLADVAWTLRVGRREHPSRAAVLVTGRDAAAAALDEWARGGRPLGELPDAARRWLAGEPLEWDFAPAHRCSVPGVPWAQETFWLPKPPVATCPAQTGGSGPLSSHKETLVADETRTRRRSPVRLSPVTVEDDGGAPTEAKPLDSQAAAPPVEDAPEPPTAMPAAALRADREVLDSVREVVAAVTALEVDAVGGDADFSDLGLDSIMRMDVAKRIGRRWGVQVESGELYELGSPRALAAAIVDRLGEDCGDATARALAAAVNGSQEDGPSAAEEPRLPGGPVEQNKPTLADNVPALDQPDVGDSQAAVENMLLGLIAEQTGHTLSRSDRFPESGLSSFDMLRVVSSLESRVGVLPKTLMFDHPTPAELAAHLAVRGDAGRLTPPVDDAADAAESDRGEGFFFIRKDDLPHMPEWARLVEEIDASHAREQGMAGRHIAPMVAITPDRQAYFHVARFQQFLFAWSYAGPPPEYAARAGALFSEARARGLNAAFLSLETVPELAGESAHSTPIGAVQRVEDLASFSTDGGAKSRLRYMVKRFAKEGEIRVEEYEVGSDPETDRSIADLMDRWGETKQMVNPYVPIVREQILRGGLAERHRMYLTWLDDRMVSAVIVTRLPSENTYLLDLEFYAEDMPLGGLEYTCVQIIDQLGRLGVETFSLGASFGVQVTDVDEADAEVREALDQLSSIGVFSRGNYQFKSKFRPTDTPIYLVQAGPDRAPLSRIILMIASPDLESVVPGTLMPGTAGPAPEPSPVTAKPTEPTQPVEPTGSPAGTASTSDRADSAVPELIDPTDREGALRRAGWNALALPHEACTLDALTDSLAEQPRLVSRLAAEPGRPAPSWLPDTAVITPTGRAAEDLLAKVWPGGVGTVHHDRVFPSWEAQLLDAGCAVRDIPVDDQGQVDVRALADAVASGDVVLVESATNARAGRPLTRSLLAALRDVAHDAGAFLVLDATRLVDEVAAALPDASSAEVLAEVGAVLRIPDASTMSLTKSFGTATGGLLIANEGRLAERLAERVGRTGQPVGAVERDRIRAALADDRVVDRVRRRLSQAAVLREALDSAGADVEPSSSGAVVVRIDAAKNLAMPAELAWYYRAAGLRAAPLLLGIGRGVSGDRIRIAVPLGVADDTIARIAADLAAQFPDRRLPELLELPALAGLPAYHPRELLPDDVGDSLAEKHQAADDNARLLQEAVPSVVRRIVKLPLGDVEVYENGSGRPLVLCNPFNIGAACWVHQLQELSADHRVIAIHHSGQGATTVADELTWTAMAKTVRDVLDALEIDEPVDIIGSSFGGLVATTFALDYPERVGTLLLLGSSHQVGNRRQSGEVNRLDVVMREDFDACTAADPSFEGGRRDFERVLSGAETMDPHVGLRFLDVFAAKPDLLPRLGELQVPVVIMHGTEDTVVPPRVSHLLYGAISHSELVPIPGAGHFPQLTHWQAVNDVIVRHVAGEPVAR